MKASLALTLIILAAAAGIGWQQRGRLETARTAQRAAAQEALALGLSPEALIASGNAPLRTKSVREGDAGKQAAAQSLAKELIAFATEMNAMQAAGTPPDEAAQKRIMEMVGRLLDLSPAQLKTLIAELMESDGVDDESRRNILTFAIMTLADTQPESALAIYTSGTDLGMEGMSQHIIASSLGKWAERDPLAAMEWVRKNSEKHADLITDETKAAILTGAARQDPKLALSLIDDLKLDSPQKLAASLAAGAATPEERTALLAALRGEKKHAGVIHPTLRAMGDQLSSQGYHAGMKWLATADLTTDESAAIASGISGWRTGADTGRWLDWMVEKQVPAETLHEKTSDFIGQWANRDFQAASDWINATQPGPVKTIAVKSFALAVARYEPESARQWAESLPAGKERDDLLKDISQRQKAKAGQ